MPLRNSISTCSTGCGSAYDYFVFEPLGYDMGFFNPHGLIPSAGRKSIDNTMPVLGREICNSPGLPATKIMCTGFYISYSYIAQ